MMGQLDLMIAIEIFYFFSGLFLTLFPEVEALD